MHEFSSVSVSSYDAASLADKLTEKSAEGWDVVAILPTGTNVTAYLRRAGGTSASEAATEAAADDVMVAEHDTGSAAAVAAGVGAAGSDVAEPAGWAVAPESSGDTGAEAAQPVETVAADTGASSTGWADTGSGGTSTGAEQAAAAGAATTYGAESQQATQATQQQAAAAAAPAGWYADPSGRYELRYWDGTQWTEHVSRAGQQYTDPPVA